MIQKRTIAAAVCALSVAAVTLMPVGAQAAPGAAPPPIRPLIPCPEDRSPLFDGSCASPDEMHQQNQFVLRAKTQTANAYVDSLYAVGQKNRFGTLENRLLSLTGENSLVAESQAEKLTWTRESQFGLKVDARQLPGSFFPFEQINSFYCGPATVMSILYALGAMQSQTRNTTNSQFERLNGNPEHDQTLLAQDFWLATDKNDGTNWGELYVPYTLNAWRGSRWYVLDSTPAFDGSLTKDQALRNIRYDTDRGYPIAENVLYSPETYYPAGFWPGVRYQHWDVIYGMSTANDETRVQIGQTYHDTRLPYDRFQSILWDVHWVAIENWHGIVW